ncbi:MAG: DUF4296 domain-containing protein [Bacteroidales bacterium]|jgi:hypothetical protein|nr:DUF4296 domain-containing protein [Bacteroidales bacterium]
MKKVLQSTLIIFIFSVFFSCINVKPEYTSPQGYQYIKLDTIELILYDIHLSDAIITTGVYNPANDILTDTLIYESIYKKYSYSRKQIDESLLYYMHNQIDSLYAVYDRIFERLSREKGKNT